MPMTFVPKGTDVDDVALADLAITRGDDIEVRMEVTDDGAVVPLTGYSALLQVRSVDGAAIFAFESEAEQPTIIIEEATGTLIFVQTAEATASIPTGRYLWDLQLTDGDGLTRTVARGYCIVMKDQSV